MTERRLRVHTRPLLKGRRDPKSCLFARLSPRTARYLLETAVSDDDDTNDYAPGNGWSVVSRGSSDIEFLPLKVLLESGDIIYTSYNGGSIADEEAIDLPEFIVPPGVNGHFANVTALTSVTDAASIEVDPLTPEDWELLEVHSEFLERGALLSQVSIVYPNQILTLTVGAFDTVQFRVLPFPNKPCFRLVANTEVIVIPKPRPVEPAPSTPLRVVPCWDDWSPRMQALAMREGIPIPKVLPCSIMVHPETLEEHLPGWKGLQMSKSTSPLAVLSTLRGEYSTVVQVTESCDVLKDHAALHTLIQWQLEISPFEDMITIKLLSEKRESEIVAQRKSLLEQGALRLNLGPVNIDVPAKTAPWRYPTCVLAQTYFNHAVANVESDSILAALNNLPQGYENCPLSHGSLIALPCSGPGRHEFWRVSLHTDPQNTIAWDLFLPMEDVKDLGLRTCAPIHGAVSCNQIITVTTSSSYQILNWLPLHDLITQSLKDLLSHAFSMSCFCHGFIIYGEKGTGKTHTALVLAAISRLRFAQKTVYLDCSRFQAAGQIRMHETLEELSAVFEAASTSGPSLLILDNLDYLLPNFKRNEDGESTTNNLQVNQIEMDQTKLLSHHVYFLAKQLSVDTKLVITCNEQKSIAPSALPSDRVYEYLTVPSLGTIETGQMLSTTICQTLELRSICLPFDLNRRIEGYRPADVERLSAIVCQNLRSKFLSSKLVECDDATLHTALDAATSGFVPILRQGVRDENSLVISTWRDIGGLFEAKRHLTSSILHPVKYRRIYENAPTQLPRGLLLFGPPGCGKSLIVPALAKECDLALITCHGPELLDKFIGASEHKVRQLFARAQAAAPSLLFLDEFEALAPRRGSDHTGVTDRVVNQLLTFLDGVESTLDRVYVVAATSRPDKIDPALLRPGRLEKHVYIGFPATEDEWTDVFFNLARSRKVEEEVMLSIESGNLYREMMNSSALSFSPADLKAVLDTAQLAAVHEYLRKGSNDGNLIVTMKHIRGALHSARPSLSADDRSRFESLYAPLRGMQGDRQPKTLKTTLR